MEIIRKIVIGNDPMKAMAYFIGQKAGMGNVSAIVLKCKNSNGAEKACAYWWRL